MNKSIFRMTLDIHEGSSQAAAVIKREDTIRSLHITLAERGEPYVITPECTAVFTALKPDGNIIFNDCTIIGNEIFYDLTPQTTACVGIVPCEIRLYGADDALLTSPQFTLVVVETIYVDGVEIESATEVTALTHLISETTALKEEIERKLANGEFNGPPGKTPEKGVDYWTEADKQDIVSEVLNQMPATTFEVGHGLKLSEDRILSVETVNKIHDEQQDNTLPITAAAVYETVGNIEILLGTI